MWVTALLDALACAGRAVWVLGGTTVQTVRGDVASVERRLVAGRLRCPCGGVLAPWSYAVSRVVATSSGVWRLRPRRSRCVACRVTHVLLPTLLFSRRAYAGMVIWACVVARACGAKVVSIALRAGVPVSTVAGWLRRFADRAPGLRQVLMGVLRGVDARVRRVIPAGSTLGDALAVLGAVTSAVRGRGSGLDTVTDQEMASHLTRGLLLTPSLPHGLVNTSPFMVPAAIPS
jgi:hypothetical protein